MPGHLTALFNRHLILRADGQAGIEAAPILDICDRHDRRLPVDMYALAWQSERGVDP